MPSQIETELLIPQALLALTALEVKQGSIELGFSDREQLGRVVRFSFDEASISSVEGSYDDEDKSEGLNMPWDIIGFDSNQVSPDLWEFVLHTHVLELVFRARWPQSVAENSK